MKFNTIADALRRGADRHWQRGMMHSIVGHPSYAVGSYAKAMRWERRAEESKQFWLDLRPMEPLFEAFASDVDQSLSEMFGL